ncbi:RNA polymerase sigma factor [bacterium]|nr:RNA polymerase sigma factor [bacterium]
MYNPFNESQDDNSCNLNLIKLALEGNREGLEQLIKRHQAWIFNIAFKMTSDVNDAEDVTQEILIKILTKLSSYDPEKSAFRTWLYRITANHIINMKKRTHELHLIDIDDIGTSMKRVRNSENVQMVPDPESKVLLKEAKSICLNGMLLCLDRRQRLVFILGEILGVTGTIGGEIMEISAANFRKILSRAREKLINFFDQKCGLIDEKNPCRCSLYLKVVSEQGLIDQQKLAKYNRSYPPVSEVTNMGEKNSEKSYQSLLAELYGNEAFLDPPNQTAWIRKTIQSQEFKSVFHM